MRPVVIIGAGGFAREVLDVIDAINDISPRYDFLGYIVDPEYGVTGTLINGKPILGGFDWLEKEYREVQVICGVGSSYDRYHLVKRAEKIGCRFFSVIHPTAVLTRWVQIGTGVVITAGCILSNQILLGDHVQVNLSCTIGHDVVTENFVSLAPGVHVSGNVTIREGVYIGTGSNVIEKLELGEWSTIGAGSVVIKNVPPNTTIAGVPAKIIKRHKQGWYLF